MRDIGTHGAAGEAIRAVAAERLPFALDLDFDIGPLGRHNDHHRHQEAP